MYIKGLLLAVVCIGVSGCALFTNSNPSIPVIDLESSEKCGVNKTPYVDPNARFAVCLDKQMAMYLYCVDALRRSTVTRQDQSAGNLTILPNSGSVDGQATTQAGTQYGTSDVSVCSDTFLKGYPS